MIRTIWINCSKNSSATASMWDNSVHHSTVNLAAKDTKLGSLGVTGLPLWIHPDHMCLKESYFSDC